MSDETLLKTALRVLSCYARSEESLLNPDDVSLLVEAAAEGASELPPDLLAIHIIRRKLGHDTKSREVVALPALVPLPLQPSPATGTAGATLSGRRPTRPTSQLAFDNVDG